LKRHDAALVAGLLLVAGAGISACTGTQTSALRASPRVQATPSRPRPSQNIELPYQFSLDGFQVAVSTPAITEKAGAFGQTVDETTADDERWLSVGVTVEEEQGRERLFPWITMVRLRTALGAIVNAPHALSSRPTPLTGDELSLAPKERDEIRLFFRVKRGDFPVDLIFADGGAAPLGN
jgi:hypothetical protein